MHPLLAVYDATDLWVLAAYLGISVIFCLVAKHQATAKQGQNLRGLETLAAQLGVGTTTNLQIPVLPRSDVEAELSWNFQPIARTQETGVAGQKEGRELHCATYAIGAGRTRLIYREIAVAVTVPTFKFTLALRLAGSKLLEILGDVVPKTGDGDFDECWLIQSSHPQVVLALLTPELRALLNALTIFPGSTFIFEDNWSRYRENGDFSDLRNAQRFAEMARLMLKFALEIELTAERFAPLPPPPSPPGWPDDEKPDDDWGTVSPDWARWK